MKWERKKRRRRAFTLNNAITTEKKLINAVAKISGLEKAAGLLYTWIWKMLDKLELNHWECTKLHDKDAPYLPVSACKTLLVSLIPILELYCLTFFRFLFEQSTTNTN